MLAGVGAVVNRPRLGAHVVAMHMDPDGSRAFPSLPTIAACMGLERSGAGRAVKELIEGG